MKIGAATTGADGLTILDKGAVGAIMPMGHRVTADGTETQARLGEVMPSDPTVSETTDLALGPQLVTIGSCGGNGESSRPLSDASSQIVCLSICLNSCIGRIDDIFLQW